MATNLEFIKSASGTSVSSLSVTDCFSADYDVYYIDFVDLDLSSAQNLQPRLIDNTSTVITGNEYDYASLLMRSYGAFSEEKTTNATVLGFVSYDSSVNGQGTSLYIYNPYDSSSYTFIQWQSSSHSITTGGLGRKGIAVHKSAEQITGINFIPFSGTINNLTVNVYGVK